MSLFRLPRLCSAPAHLSAGPRVVELKAIKLYVNSYRDRSISHEEVSNRIVDDLVAACDPVWLQLEADFNPRGNVHTVVRVSHGTRQPC